MKKERPSPPKKRQKTASNKNDDDDDDNDKKPRAVTVNYDALSSVMAFLAPRELLRLSLTCKTMRDTVTTSTVVKSAMIHGGHPRRNIEELYPLMKDGSIFAPSPQRLLRLVNGKYCEVCKNSKVNHVRPGYGVFFCWDCLSGRYTRKWKTEWARYRKNPAYERALYHDRVAPKTTYGDSKPVKFLMVKHYSEGGEKVGPIVRFGDIDHMVSHSEGMDDYLQSVLASPEMDEYLEFTQSYDECKERAKIEEKARKLKKRECSAQSKARKSEKAVQIQCELKELVDQRWRKVALTYRKAEPNKYRGPIEFKVKFVNALLKPYMIAPSKMKKKIMTEISTEINTKFEKVATSFLSYDFLSEDDPFQAKLKVYVSKNLTSLEALDELGFGPERLYSRKDFFDSVDENRQHEALAVLFDDDFSWVLLPPAYQKEFFRRNAYAYRISVPKRDKYQGLFCLARFAFYFEDKKYREKSTCESSKPDDVLVHRWSRVLPAVEDTFSKLHAGFLGFRQWLQAKYDEDQVRTGVRRWKNFLQDIYYYDIDTHYGRSCVRFLLQSDFEEVEAHLVRKGETHFCIWDGYSSDESASSDEGANRLIA